MKRLALIACCLLLCLWATDASAVNSVVVQTRSVTPSVICTVGVYITNDIPLTGLVVMLETRMIAGDGYYDSLTQSNASMWNVQTGSRLRLSPLGGADPLADPDNGIDPRWPAPQLVRSVHRDANPANPCSGPTSNSYSAANTRAGTTSPDGFLFTAVSTGDEGVGDLITLEPGTDPGNLPSLRFIFNGPKGNGCFIVDTACLTPASHLIFVNTNTQPVQPDFTPGLITVGTGSCVVQPNVPPTAICQDVKVSADGNCQGAVTAAQVNNGSNDPEDGTNVTLQLIPPGPFAVGAHNVRLIVTDTDGDTSSCGAVVTVNDVTPPSIACPSNIAVQCGSNVPAAYADAAAFVSAGGTVTDNCPGTTVTLLDQVSDGLTCPNVITRRYVATDAAGNKDTCTQLVTVDDTQNPVITDCPNDTVINLPNGQTSTQVFYSDADITDNCNNVNIIHSPLSGSVFNVGTTNVRLIVTDNCGNADTCFFDVTVNELPAENTPPDAQCQNVQVGTDANCQGTATAAQVNNGSSDGQTAPGNLVLTLNPAGPYALGANPVWLVVTDEGGLKDSCEATITVVDDDNPSVTCPSDITMSCGSLPSPYADLAEFIAAGGSASDNCDASLTFSLADQQCVAGTLCDLTCTRTYRVTDDAGNFDECVQIVRVADTIPPSITCPNDIKVTVSAGTTDTIITYSPAGATDNCDQNLDITYSASSGSSFPVGTTVVEVIAMDDCGNADTCEFTIEVNEAVLDAPPVANCVNIKVSANANCQGDGSVDNFSYDPDGGSVIVQQIPAGPYGLGVNNVTLIVTDDEGDADTCEATVTVNDVTPPTVACIGDIETKAEPGQCGAVVIWSNHASTDDCSLPVSTVFTPDDGSFFPVGTTQVKQVVTDAAGNKDSCFFDVTVVDNEPPTVQCTDIKVSNDLGLCSAEICESDIEAAISYDDNCQVDGWIAFVRTPVKAERFEKGGEDCIPVPVGTYDLVVVVYDASGNTSDSCRATLTVNDTEAPSITCPADIKVFAPFGETTTIVNYPAPITSDNCGIEDTRCHPASGSSFTIGQTVVTCTTWDAAGNNTSCSFTITVNEGSLDLVGPHTEVEQLDFKVTCGCDTQSVDIYCVFPPGKSDPLDCFYNVVTDVPGVSAVPSQGLAPAKIDIIVCGDGLNPDTYSGWVYLYNAPGNRSDSFWVVVEVNEDTPGIEVDPDTLCFTYTGNYFEDKLCLPATIRATGCDDLCWQLVGGSGDWVWVDPTSDTAGLVEICVTNCAFEPGTYYHTLYFCPCEKGPELAEGCDSLVVKLKVIDPPILVVEPLEIHFDIDCEKKALPAGVEVTNGGGGILDWHAWTDANWFIIEPDEGTAPETFYVSIVPDSILCPNDCDTLLDSICVVGNKGCALNSQQWVIVQLIICPDVEEECDSICGNVWDCICDSKVGCGIDGAIVELWDSYPDGSIIKTDTADWGDFCFEVEPGVEYDIRFWKEGYCTDTIDGWSCEDGYLSFCLWPLDFVLPESPMFHDYYSQNATFEGFPVQPGDVIYATDSGGQVVGLAYVTVPGEYFIHVVGNVPKGDPDPIDEGAEIGEFVQLWLNCECPVTVDTAFVNFGNSIYDAAWDCRPTGICCELCEGWSMFSYNIQLPDYSRENVLATIDLNYSAVRTGVCNDDGPSPQLQSWFDNRPINDLYDVTPWHGYDINMTQTDTLCLEGFFIPVDTELPLCEGWNYIPYYPMESDSREHALASIAGNYNYIYNIWACGDDPSDSWVSGRPVNDLFCLEPCKGYWIRMTDEDTLVYPTDGYDCNEPLPKVSPSHASGQIRTSPIVADFWSNTDASTSGLNAGDIITVRSESGAIIGETVVDQDGVFLVHVFGDVPNTAVVEGAQPRESLRFEVNGLAASVEGNTTFNDRENSQITVRASGANPVPDDYALLQNYPNPFNAGTVIPFTMKDASEWTLTVYNIMGQTVQTFEGFDAAGTVRVNWNGSDRNGQGVPSGVYFYRVTTDTWTATKKMTLLK